MVDVFTTCTCRGFVTWQIVDVSSIQQQVSIERVTEWGQVPRQGHTGPHVPPQAACRGNNTYGLSIAHLLLIPVNLSDPHGRRSPAIQNEKAGGLAQRLF